MSRLDRLRERLRRVGSALSGFLHGFVGETDLPREKRAACQDLAHRASGRGRCC